MFVPNGVFDCIVSGNVFMPNRFTDAYMGGIYRGELIRHEWEEFRHKDLALFQRRCVCVCVCVCGGGGGGGGGGGTVGRVWESISHYLIVVVVPL